ncbi:hypothetical protein [Arthrobacter humicola]
MKRLSWRALRPLLFAGAAATAWLTLSAPGASADAASDPGSLLGNVSSSASSVTEAAVRPVAGALAAAAPSVAPGAAEAVHATLSGQPSTTEHAGLLSPITGPATGTVDRLIEAVPLVNTVVPSGSVGTITAPVVEAADGIVVEIVQQALPAASDALPALDPAVDPVGELLTGVELLPDNGAALLPGVPAPSEWEGGTAGDVTPPLVLPVSGGPESSRELSADPAKSAVVSASKGSRTLPTPHAGSIEAPLPADKTPYPAALPAVPGSGSGSSQYSGSGAGGAAWLSDFHMDVPLNQAVPVSGPLQTSPAPVSFDPGSSPD